MKKKNSDNIGDWLFNYDPDEGVWHAFTIDDYSEYVRSKRKEIRTITSSSIDQLMKHISDVYNLTDRKNIN